MVNGEKPDTRTHAHTHARTHTHTHTHTQTHTHTHEYFIVAVVNRRYNNNAQVNLRSHESYGTLKYSMIQHCKPKLLPQE